MSRSRGRPIRSLAVAVLFLAGACTSHADPTTASSRINGSGVIVFVNDPLTQAGHLQLFIEDDDGSHVRSLVRSGFNDTSPSISPDGSTILFTRQDDPRPDRIFEVRPDGSGLHQLIPTGCPGRCGDAVEGNGAFSPDGSKIVFTRAIYAHGPKPVHVQLWTANADGTDAVQITDPHHAQDDEAAWSPDGTQIAYMHWSYHPDRFVIQIANADGTGSRQVTPDGLDVADPAWSPDGSLIAFQSPPDPAVGQQLYTIHPDGSGLRSLTPELGGQATFHPSWSGDGTELVFAHAPSGPLGGDLFVIDRDGSGVHVLRVTPLNENAPAWGAAASP